ncbi:hypothetical protein A2697_02110 [Candidatus Curtissbacteria bacterium RIFCSPHIGHO2_01_FULL_41_44]|uniref:Peptidase S51 n=1 Tax=Candidatus Curtissbacteria bacterium RIFCSPLOWO2_01_FULL_42_50 TaxID=1797730 RepID=A0A1F5H3W8_9BACT|nr:MAG: hypothetical protein A2697_02110 [Candidatus Curtissbacteria bacterium RIFCSPHIGHO2_01_FULL_41_44]OGD94653.1 MAG: hypothetical protein A3C33_01260 [Candidatus Curtissbacteria bacterium RIFCSPHIGHO2_02_FULL_42_58]OGD96849.1 MAG: hypothetical protein A3E71_03050 [Candidatus Curtissbacteria bacterium RIFCSPHIGHO2_12_FULL_42_33]OGD98737.1 MAG: hypothetical protein A3B54_04820 [Candidatus Curtissbacteria bacterium RIFCSPLOWO2_01_FULL_42_50]OGE02238.1 MAG: hypothetical protein A3G16_01125 [Ca
MKLLLTSNGLANETIVKALHELIGRSFNKTKLAFIPTAANVEEGDKLWLIDDLTRCKNLGFAMVDIVDISALPKNFWQPRIEEADVLLFGGGNVFHLMYWLNKSSLSKLLPNLLEERVYIGISAGSMVCSKRILLSQSKRLYYEDIKGKHKGQRGLGFVNFQIRPHLNNQYFPKVRAENLKKLAKEIPEPIYALDDGMALKVVDERVEVVGEGEYLLFNSNI